MTLAKFNSQFGSVLLASTYFSRSATIRDVLLTISSVAVDISGSHGGGIWLVCTHELRRCVLVNPSEHSEEDAVFQIGQGPAGICAATGKPVITDDMSVDPTVNLPGVVRQQGIRACLTVPLILGSETLGVISVFRRISPRRYIERDVRTLQGFCEMASLAIDHCLRRPEVAKSWCSYLKRWNNWISEHLSPSIDVVSHPKTISATTLGHIRAYLKSVGHPVDCSQIAQSVSVSLATARRYVDYMAKVGLAKMTLEYGSVGRPRHQYFL